MNIPHDSPFLMVINILLYSQLTFEEIYFYNLAHYLKKKKNQL